MIIGKKDRERVKALEDLLCKAYIREDKVGDALRTESFKAIKLKQDVHKLESMLIALYTMVKNSNDSLKLKPEYKDLANDIHVYLNYGK